MYIGITGAMLPRNKKGWFIMTNEQMYFESKCGYYDFYSAIASTKSKAKKIICSKYPDVLEDDLEDDFVHYDD